MPAIRNSVKAIIIRDNQILTMKAKDADGPYYLLPGGGQHHGETMRQALARECIEEIGCHIQIEELLFIREYIGINHEFSEHDSDTHQIECMFRCRLLDNQEPKPGTNPDINQIGFEWLDLNIINKYRLYPKDLRTVFANLEHENRIYFGDIN